MSTAVEGAITVPDVITSSYVPYKTKPLAYKSLKTGNEFPYKYANIDEPKMWKDVEYLPLPLDEYPYTLTYEQAKPRPAFDKIPEFMLKVWTVKDDLNPANLPMSIRADLTPEEDFFYQVYLELEKMKSDSDKEFDARYYKAAANWVNGPVMSWLKRNKKEDEEPNIDDFPVKPEFLRALICYVEFTDLITFSTAVKDVLPEMAANPDEHPWSIIERLNLIQSNDESEIEMLIKDVLSKFPAKVAEYKGGKTGIAGMFVGEVMKASPKKLNPKIVSEKIKTILDSCESTSS